MSIESMRPSNHLILCRLLLLLPSIFPSIRIFSSKSVLHTRWPKYWSFSFSISPSKEHPGRISFRIDWLDLLAVQGTFKSLLQHHGSKHLRPQTELQLCSLRSDPPPDIIVGGWRLSPAHKLTLSPAHKLTLTDGWGSQPPNRR